MTRKASDRVQSQDKEQDQGQAFELADDPDSILDEKSGEPKTADACFHGKISRS
ncbi:MAG: hypothetical protein R2875_15425 [Desulfobacterales bacterium]